MSFDCEKENIKDANRLFPYPRELQWKEGMFSVNSGTKIFVAVNAYRRAAELLQEQIKDRFGMELPIEAYGMRTYPRTAFLLADAHRGFKA